METICCWRQYKLAQRPNNNGTFLLYLKGKDGENGITPHVGEMVIGILAIVIQIFRLKVKRRNGKDGTSPYIGPNGNWWINTSDTK